MTNLNLPSNSDKSTTRSDIHTEPTREKRVEQVTSATQAKPRKGALIKDAFSGDDVNSVGHYLFFDVIIPTTKTLVADLVVGGIERLLFGGSDYSPTGRRTVGRGSGSSGPRTPYSRISTDRSSSRVGTPGSAYSGRDRAEPYRDDRRRDRASHDFRGIIIQTRGEAERVLDILQETIDTYNQTTVSDLYDAVGMTADFTDDKWGWTDISGSAPERVRDGYILSLPRPINLDL